MTTQSAEYIYNNCKLLIKENCLLYEGKLYERLTNCHYRYRFFLSTDHYDFLEDQELSDFFDEYDVGIELCKTTVVSFDLTPETLMDVMYEIDGEVTKLCEAQGLKWFYSEGLAPGRQVGFYGHLGNQAPVEELLTQRGCSEFHISVDFAYNELSF